MRIIRTFPWILAVADTQFDHVVARGLLLQNAAKEIMKIRTEHSDYDVISDARISSNYFELFIKGFKKTIPEVVSGENKVFRFLR